MFRLIVPLLLLVAISRPTLAQQASDILTSSGIKGGLVVCVGCDDPAFLMELRANDSYLVQGLDADAAKVAKARAAIQAKGLYGKVTADVFDGKTLPYIDKVVNLLVVQGGQVPDSELRRVLAPRGMAIAGRRKILKDWPGGIDEWTHYLRAADNNAVADDSLVGPPKHLKWLSDPKWSRHHDKLASISTVVTAKGRLFYIVDEGPVYEPNFPARWSVAARDAFNGVFLWKKPISRWTTHTRKFRSGPVQLQRLLVTDGDKVFVTLGLDEPISVLDAATGKDLGTLPGTEKTEEMVLKDGTLVVQIGEKGSEQAILEGLIKGVDYRTTKLIKAIDVKSGKTAWRWPASETAEIMPRTLTVSGDGVFCQEKGETLSLALADGKVRWRTEGLAPKPPKAPTPKKGEKQTTKKRKKKGGSGRSPGWTFCTLVAKDGVVLSCDGGTLTALDAKSGKTLWSCAAKTPFGRTPSVDILVVNGVVWTSPGFGSGRDLRTGEVVASNNLQQELVTAGHHHRCYRNKATSRYIIEGYRGLEFMDTKGANHVRHNWIRGVCQYGIMPANGLVYIPSHNCGCYPEAKLYGFWTLSANQSAVDADKLAPSSHLEKGPAYGNVSTVKTSGWTMHRGDAARSCTTPASIPATVKPGWTAEVGGRISSPVVANGTLLIAAKAAHQILAFDAKTGAKKWAITTGGPVDSAPTICGNVALFGSADGCVYCVTLDKGERVWRFRAAPMDRRTVVLQNVESLWPVHGSVLVSDGIAYFTAGRSSYLDGGLFLYGLDPATGAVKYQKRLVDEAARAMTNDDDVKAEGFAQNRVDYKTAGGPDKSDAFSMAGGNISDIMVAQDGAVYLRHMKFDKDLKRNNDWTFHVFSTSRLIDDNESHRSHIFYGRGDFSRLPVAYEWLTRGSYGGFESPLGKLLAFDGKTLWGTRHHKGHVLFACDISGIEQQIKKDFPHSKEKKPFHPKPLISSMDIHARALIKAGEQLVVGGFPAEPATVHQYGKPIEEKGVLMLVSPQSGDVTARMELDSPPVFDGMAAVDGALYVSCEDGRVMCLK